MKFSGDKLRKIRVNKGLSQEHLGYDSDTSGSEICKLENGKISSPRLDTISRIAKALGVKTMELIIND